MLYRNPLARIDDCDLGYDVVGCARCAFAYADNLAPTDVYRRYYSRYSKYDTIESADDIPLLSRQMALNAAAFLKPHARPDSSIIDLGCSIGLLLGTMKGLGYRQVAGIDPGPNSAAVAKRLFDVPVSTGFLDENTDLSSFDVLILAAVMEHLTDFHRTLPAATATLREGALLYVEVPAADRFGKLRNAEPFGEFSLEHVDFFGATSLENFFHPLGFRTIARRHVLYVSGAYGLMMLFRKDGGTHHPARVRDEPLRRSLDAYVECSGRRMQAVNDRLRPLAGRPVIVYGAGSHTARLLRQSALPDCRILFIADRNPNLHGATLDGLPIHDPSALAEHPEVPIVVSSCLAEKEISESIRRTLPNPVVLLYGQAHATDAPLRREAP